MDSPHLGDLSPAGTIAIGIIVGLLSTSIQSVGLTLQRKSHQLEDEKEDELIRRPPYRRRRWQIGMFMFIIANLVGSTIQITTLPLPVLSTLQASGLVFNTICASIILHEPFNRWSFVGTALVAGGAVLIAMFGALTEPSHDLAQHIKLLGRRQFVLWMTGTFIAMAVILLAIFFTNHFHAHHQPPFLRRARGFAFGAISSILSAHSLLIAKSAVELLVRTIVDHSNQFNRWQSWIILLLLVFFALSQLYFLHRGLKLVSTSILYPFVFCIYNIVAILDGLIYFRQTSRVSTLHAVLIALGTFILLSGVLALSWRLDEEKYSAPPPEAHSLLTPGMGIVEDTTTEDEAGDTDFDIDADNSSMTSADEEAAVAFTGEGTERTPLLLNGSLRHYSKQDPSSKDGSALRVSKQRRQRFAANPPALLRRQSEADDVWDELQDSDTHSRPQPVLGGPTSHPRGWEASQIAPQPRRASTMGLASGARAAHYKTDQPFSSSPETGGLDGARPAPKGHSRVRARTMGPGPGLSGRVGISGAARSTWRERDRERRRRGPWSGAVGFSAPRRAFSTPVASTGSSSRRRGETAETAAEAAMGNGRRDGSLRGWLVGWWTGQRSGGLAADRGDEDNDNIRRPEASGEGSIDVR